MKRRKKKSRVGWLIALLALALIAVIALVIFKQWEYGASEDFYNGLRGAAESGGLWL